MVYPIALVVKDCSATVLKSPSNDALAYNMCEVFSASPVIVKLPDSVLAFKLTDVVLGGVVIP
jgi:hypothetical protein